MRLDLKRIEAKIQYVEENLTLLRELASYSEADFVCDKVKFYAGVYALQVSTEAMLDTFSHIIARLHLGAPTSDRETLEIAFQKGLIPQDHLDRFLQMSKFRNRVVHGYMDTDPKKVYQIIQGDLGDFQLFFDDVRRIVEKEEVNDKKAKRRKE